MFLGESDLGPPAELPDPMDETLQSLVSPTQAETGPDGGCK